MKTNILLFFVSIFLIGCNSEEQELELTVKSLKKQNDSLKSIIDTLNTKYIFDEATLTTIPMLWKENKPGEFTTLICYVASNKNDTILFSKEYNHKTGLKNPDTLSGEELILKVNRKETKFIHYEQLSKPKFGKKIDYVVSDPMKNYR